VPFGIDLGLCSHEPRFSLGISLGQPQSRIASARWLNWDFGVEEDGLLSNPLSLESLHPSKGDPEEILASDC
jgi:hypothetical protein